MNNVRLTTFLYGIVIMQNCTQEKANLQKTKTERHENNYCIV